MALVRIFCLALILTTQITGLQGTRLPRKVLSFPIANAAFTTLVENKTAPQGQRWNFYASAFSAIPFSKDYVYVVRGIERYLLKNSTNVKPDVVTHDTVWPNEISGVPAEVFGKPTLAVPDGFLLPTKTAGDIGIYDINVNPPRGPFRISHDDNDKQNWFYHRVIWKDMNGDGRLDAVAARAEKPFFGNAKGELLWFEHPSGDPFTSQWKPHLLLNGPDTFIINATMKVGNGVYDTIIAPQFFSQALVVYWSVAPLMLWTDPSKIRSVIIDDKVGPAFDARVVDLNADQKPDLLVTSNQAQNGAVFAYQLDYNLPLENTTFVKHVLADGFTPRQSGQGKGSPGAAKPFYPSLKNATGKPHILVCGDDDGRAYLLIPQSADPSNWKYSKEVFFDGGKETVGEIAIEDVDGDGFVEVFVPLYYKGEVIVFSFGP
ncbi:uncharacterized protein LOC106161970 [Lingula anatina]|uniref:Uncharacterized protein LOC106161970 n=1 Tax=Lingula anatina TaxID=7574 RepID=A0A1S3I8I5_LINAN|nr:uncharacterized protein LOC106161970 [Lingula anatina]|eukprot:XP_013394503.1 uncharacterized protein LOC106161970 [Lingula anatina]